MLDQSGIYPPRSPRPLWWSELTEISLKDLSSDPTNPRFVLYLSSKLGRKIALPLSNFDRASLLHLTSAIEQYAPSCRNSSLLGELPRFFDYQRGFLKKLSYTQLWSSISNNKFELSCFTPLASEAMLQEGRLTVKKQLSAGGFSAVYLVEDDEHEIRVLKEFVLPFGIDQSTQAKALEHFQREARLLVKLNHPRLAHVLDHFVENGRHYLLLEYINGANMRTYVAEHGRQNETLVDEWALALAETLAYLHAQEPPVIHRDISPDNIIIREDGVPILIDFGAANEFVGSATGTLIGKHAYMAPEQIQGKAEPASDIYSLGGTLYFCLTGMDPEPLRRASPREIDHVVSENTDALIRHCTTLDIKSRCSSARELIDCLSPIGLLPGPQMGSNCETKDDTRQTSRF
jgi:predicted Ser/Thr protein kinase